MRKGLFNVCIGLTVAALTGSAQADLAFQQLPDQVNCWYTDAGGVAPKAWRADDFATGTAYVIGSITFWGAYQPFWAQPTDDFTISFYEDGSTFGSGTSPGALVLSTSLTGLTRIATGNTIAGALPEYRYTADLATTFSTSAGAPYWISIVNNTGLGGAGGWLWETSAQSGHCAYTGDSGATWQIEANDLAFELHGTPVPSPGALALLGLAAARRSSRRRLS